MPRRYRKQILANSRYRIYAEIKQAQGGAVEYRSSYDAGLVAALKARIPNSARRWDAKGKFWLVDWRHIQTLKEITEDHLGIVPDMTTSNILSYRTDARTVQRLIKLEYLGVPKRRGSEETSYGYVDGGWNAIFTLKALREWFDPDSKGDVTQAATLYGVLNIASTASVAEIKTAYRKLARRLHPDVNKEPDAHSQFVRVNQAYEILKDGQQRRRYDAGLVFEASLKADLETTGLIRSIGWHPPLRCGWLLVEAVESLGRLKVSKILQWEDIIDSRGRAAVASWPAGAENFVVNWI